MKLYISNISPKVSEEDLKASLALYGQVLYLALSYQSVNGRRVGSAVVEMHAHEALRAYEALNGKPFRNRRLYIVPLEMAKATNTAR